MLRPRSYPELIGKALVLEAQPFETMVDDDQPWVEGLMLVLTVGVFAALARLIGGLLMAGSLPPADAVRTVLLNGWQEFALRMGPAYDLAAVEATIRQMWTPLLVMSGYASGWARLFGLLVTPLGLILQWSLVALIVFGVARAFGGRGTLNQTLGATALIAAPQTLLLLQIIPFVSVSGWLVAVWGLLILYRAVEVAHDLPWRKAALAALAPYALLALLAITGLTVAALAARFGGSL